MDMLKDTGQARIVEINDHGGGLHCPIPDFVLLWGGERASQRSPATGPYPCKQGLKETTSVTLRQTEGARPERNVVRNESLSEKQTRPTPAKRKGPPRTTSHGNRR